MERRLFFRMSEKGGGEGRKDKDDKKDFWPWGLDDDGDDDEPPPFLPGVPSSN